MSAAASGATGALGSYDAASYCSAIKALGQAAPEKSAAGPAPSSANEERLQALNKRAQAAQVKAWREVCAVLEEILPGWGNTPGTGVDVAVAAIRELAKQRGIDTFAAQSFAIVRGYRVEDDQPALACVTGGVHEFSDGDRYPRVDDTLAGFPAGFLALFQLELTHRDDSRACRP